MIAAPTPKTLRVVGAVDGDPSDPRTASGGGKNLFGAMRREGYLVGAVSSKQQRIDEFVAKARSISFTYAGWRSRYRMSMDLVRGSDREITTNLRKFRPDSYDAIFQVGAYCQVARSIAAPVFTYHDNDVLTMLESDPRMHGTSARAPYVRRRVDHEASVFARAQRIFTFSEWCKGGICKNFGVPDEKVEVVGAGSNMDESLLEGERDYAGRHLLFLGIDFERKGGPAVLEAFARLRRQMPDARLTIASRLPKGTPAPGVTSLGIVRGSESVAALMRSASAFVMPSVWEPFGFVFLEAMSASVPCIGADRFAMPEIIGDTGLVVPPNDPEALSRAMYDLLSDPDGSARLGAAARARFRERYGWDKVAQRIGAAIARELGRLDDRCRQN